VISAWGKSLSPKYNGKIGSTEASPATQVFFECLDGSFSGIVTVTVGRYQLVLHVIGGEKVLQSGRFLIVECLEFWFETLGSEFLLDVIICFDPF
jgi:hypothetical protein